MSFRELTLVGAMALALAACGGGGGGETPPNNGGGTSGADGLAIMTEDNLFVAGASLDLANAPHSLAMLALTTVNMAGDSNEFTLACPNSQHAVSDGGEAKISITRAQAGQISAGDTVEIDFSSCRFPALMNTSVSGEMVLSVAAASQVNNVLSSLAGSLNLSLLDFELACIDCEPIIGALDGEIDVRYQISGADREVIQTSLPENEVIDVAGLYRIGNYSASNEYQLSTGKYSASIQADIGAPQLMTGVFKLRTAEALEGDVWTEPQSGVLVISGANDNFIRLNGSQSDGLVVDYHALGENVSFSYNWWQFSTGGFFGIVGKAGIDNILNPIRHTDDTGQPYLLLSQTAGINESLGSLYPSGHLQPNDTVSFRYNRTLPWQGLRVQPTEYNGIFSNLYANLDARGTLLSLSLTGEFEQQSIHSVLVDELNLHFSFSLPILVTVSLPQDRFVPALSLLEVEAVIDNPYNATLSPSWEAIYFDSYYNMSEWTLDWLTTDGFSAFLDTNSLYRFADGNIVYLLLRSAGGYEHVAIAADGPQEQRQYAMITQRSGELTLDEQSVAALHIGEVSLFDGGEFFSIRIGSGISNERFDLKVDSLTGRDISPFESASFSDDNAQIELSITNGHDNGIEWGGSMGEQCSTMTVNVEHLDGVAYPVDYIERYAANVTVTCDHKVVTFEVRKFTATE